MRNVICRACGLMRINPRMTQEGYETFYKEHFFEYLNPYGRPAYIEEMEHTTNPLHQTPTKRKLIPYIRPYVKRGGKVLDMGAGFGQVLYLLQSELGIEAAGLEPDPESRLVARDRVGIVLDERTVEAFFAVKQSKYDFVVLNQTFEHLLDPLGTLKLLSRHLSKEWVIYVGVPNAYNPQMHMSLFYQLAHTYNYTPHTLRLFAEKAGLKIISVRDPLAHPLEVLLAHTDASYPEEHASRMVYGSSWRDVRRRLLRKKILNVVRGTTKKILQAVGGTALKKLFKSEWMRS